MALRATLQAARDHVKTARERLEYDRPMYRELVQQQASLQRLLDIVNARVNERIWDTRSAVSEALRLLPPKRLADDLQLPELAPVIDFSDADLKNWMAADDNSVTNALHYLEREMEAQLKLKQRPKSK